MLISRAGNLLAHDLRDVLQRDEFAAVEMQHRRQRTGRSARQIVAMPLATSSVWVMSSSGRRRQATSRAPRTGCSTIYDSMIARCGPLPGQRLFRNARRRSPAHSAGGENGDVLGQAFGQRVDRLRVARMVFRHRPVFRVPP